MDVSRSRPILGEFSSEWFKLLECPGCKQYMKAPIFQCIEGHSTCVSCKEKLETCQCCEKPFSEIRNFSLEQISENVDLPFKPKPRKFGKGVYLCLAGEGYCRWRGGRNSLLEHVKEDHPRYAWMSEDNSNTGSADFSQDKNVVQIISAYGEIFWYKLCIKSKEKTRYVSVHYIGDETKGSEYFYEMAYVSDTGYKVIFSAPTHPDYVEIDNLIRRKQCSSLDFEMAQQFLVKDNPKRLNFTLKIHKK